MVHWFKTCKALNPKVWPKEYKILNLKTWTVVKLQKTWLNKCKPLTLKLEKLQTFKTKKIQIKKQKKRKIWKTLGQRPRQGSLERLNQHNMGH